MLLDETKRKSPTSLHQNRVSNVRWQTLSLAVQSIVRVVRAWQPTVTSSTRHVVSAVTRLIAQEQPSGRTGLRQDYYKRGRQHERTQELKNSSCWPAFHRPCPLKSVQARRESMLVQLEGNIR